MNTSQRLENALSKLYNAFHNNTLNPECCLQCAVGNICNNTDSWKHFSDLHGSLQLNYVGLVHQRLGRLVNGFTPQQLLEIEATFLKGCGFSIPLNRKGTKPKNPTSKETLFKGLCAVVEYLCALDNIENVMDYKKIFETEEQLKMNFTTLYT
ncbi:Na(+)-translocating NADH-quinone reductase subunit F [Marixanthomonas ophiurae]|uniref:Na(+)-translocating NADH-quinone reductase subunit F n=1 Tax=Marixanthomonas ophiurae TaxID=387659 RepID=A0A3E1Q8J8_9FLAO|nr:Na(+)-translocating NADH-quinone reductase subunit F [Marixanthomonas ophiurae]RFN58448.1 Na(+)-translocating NADH-quinone reductase subunit F [Marixanthomonas ophiurae]